MAKASKGYNIKTYMKGNLIFKEGDPGSSAFLIRSGSVDIYKVMNNKKILLERLKPGEIFGEMSILSKEPRSAYAMANEFTEVVLINKNDLEASIQKSLPIVQALANLLIKRLRRTNNMIHEHTTNNIFLSVCNVLYLLHISPDKSVRYVKEADVAVDGVIYDILVERIKEILSLSKIEIDSVMKYLVELGLIELEQKKLGPMVIKKIAKIIEPDNFGEVIKEYAKDWKPESGAFVQDLEFTDISEFAKLLGNSNEAVLKKMINGEIPIELLYVHKAGSIAWAEENITINTEKK